MVTNSFGNRTFMQPMRRLSMHSKYLVFFLLSFGVSRERGEDLFEFSFVPNRFPMCSPRVFPIAPCFNPLCFAQSPPFLTYICGPKGRHSIFPQDVLLWGASIVSTFLFVMGQSNSTKKVGLVRGKTQAKNGDELFQEEKFHAATGKAQARTQGALHFFLFSWGVGGLSEEDFFFRFSLVPTMFPLRSK